MRCNKNRYSNSIQQFKFVTLYQTDQSGKLGNFYMYINTILCVKKSTLKMTTAFTEKLGDFKKKLIYLFDQLQSEREKWQKVEQHQQAREEYYSDTNTIYNNIIEIDIQSAYPWVLITLLDNGVVQGQAYQYFKELYLRRIALKQFKRPLTNKEQQELQQIKDALNIVIGMFNQKSSSLYRPQLNSIVVQTVINTIECIKKEMLSFGFTPLFSVKDAIFAQINNLNPQQIDAFIQQLQQQYNFYLNIHYYDKCRTHKQRKLLLNPDQTITQKGYFKQAPITQNCKKAFQLLLIQQELHVSQFDFLIGDINYNNVISHCIDQKQKKCGFTKSSSSPQECFGKKHEFVTNAQHEQKSQYQQTLEQFINNRQQDHIFCRIDSKHTFNGYSILKRDFVILHIQEALSLSQKDLQINQIVSQQISEQVMFFADIDNIFKSGFILYQDQQRLIDQLTAICTSILQSYSGKHVKVDIVISDHQRLTKQINSLHIYTDCVVQFSDIKTILYIIKQQLEQQFPEHETKHLFDTQVYSNSLRLPTSKKLDKNGFIIQGKTCQKHSLLFYILQPIDMMQILQKNVYFENNPVFSLIDVYNKDIDFPDYVLVHFPNYSPIIKNQLCLLVPNNNKSVQFCAVCKREHTTNVSYSVFQNQNNYTIHCFKRQDQSALIIKKPTSNIDYYQQLYDIDFKLSITHNCDKYEFTESVRQIAKNNKYISIKCNPGLGKTHTSMKIFEDYRTQTNNKDASLLLISTRQSYSQVMKAQLLKKFNIDFKIYNLDTNQQVKSSKYVICQIESIRKLQQTSSLRARSFNYIIIDEAIQVLSQLSSGCGNILENLRVLQQFTLKADKVLLLDAFLSKPFIQCYQNIFADNTFLTKSAILHNSYKQYSNVNFNIYCKYDRFQQYIQLAKNAINENSQIVSFFSTYKDLERAQDLILVNSLAKQSEILVIHGRNFNINPKNGLSHYQEKQYTYQQFENICSQHRFVLHTSALLIGVDSQLKGFQGIHIIDCSIQTSNLVLQAILRFRNAEQHSLIFKNLSNSSVQYYNNINQYLPKSYAFSISDNSSYLYYSTLMTAFDSQSKKLAYQQIIGFARDLGFSVNINVYEQTTQDILQKYSFQQEIPDDLSISTTTTTTTEEQQINISIIQLYIIQRVKDVGSQIQQNMHSLYKDIEKKLKDNQTYEMSIDFAIFRQEYSRIGVEVQLLYSNYIHTFSFLSDKIPEYHKHKIIIEQPKQFILISQKMPNLYISFNIHNKPNNNIFDIVDPCIGTQLSIYALIHRFGIQQIQHIFDLQFTNSDQIQLNISKHAYLLNILASFSFVQDQKTVFQRYAELLKQQYKPLYIDINNTKFNQFVSRFKINTSYKQWSAFLKHHGYSLSSNCLRVNKKVVRIYQVSSIIVNNQTYIDNM